jgi:excinuclease UvrABC nuclease subunit
MQLASDRMEFERAATLRDKLHRLEELREQFGRLRFRRRNFVISLHG